MPPAIIAAGVGAAGAIGGAVLSGNAQKKAAQQATDATTAANNQATQAQLQLGNASLNQLGDIYKSNYSLLSPFVSNGISASNSLNALLGVPAGPKLTAPTTIGTGNPATTGGTNPLAPTGYTGPSLSQIMAMKDDGLPGNYAAALAAYNAANPGAQVPANNGGGGIPGIISPVGALLTGGGLFG